MPSYKGDLGWKAEGFLNPATTNLQMGTYWIGRNASGITFDASNNLVVTNALDMNSKNIHMGTGLIGYDGIASKGLQFDSGNEKLTLLSGQLILPVGSSTAPALRLGSSEYGFFQAGTYIGVAINGAFKFYISDTVASSGSDKASMNYETASATNPVFLPGGTNDADTGEGHAAANQPCKVAGGKEAQRWIVSADTDSDTDDVLLTGVSGFHGLVLVRSITDNTSAVYRVSNITVSDVDLDGDHTSTKDTASHYNFYYETDQFKLQNKVGDDKSISVAFWVLPT